MSNETIIPLPTVENSVPAAPALPSAPMAPMPVAPAAAPAEPTVSVTIPAEGTTVQLPVNLPAATQLSNSMVIAELSRAREESGALQRALSQRQAEIILLRQELDAERKGKPRLPRVSAELDELLAHTPDEDLALIYKLADGIKARINHRWSHP